MHHAPRAIQDRLEVVRILGQARREHANSHPAILQYNPHEVMCLNLLVAAFVT